jgi:hypothetical protein
MFYIFYRERRLLSLLRTVPEVLEFFSMPTFEVLVSEILVVLKLIQERCEIFDNSESLLVVIVEKTTCQSKP